MLINSFITAVAKVTVGNAQQSDLPRVIELFRSFIIELISAIRNSNQKIRSGAEEAFVAIAKVLSSYQSIPQLF